MYCREERGGGWQSYCVCAYCGQQRGGEWQSYCVCAYCGQPELIFVDDDGRIDRRSFFDLAQEVMERNDSSPPEK